MQKVRCGDCGRAYDYDDEAFCPRCGAFNQPPKSDLINEAGEVVRVDGINEQGHRDSFVHRELHEENRHRRSSGLDKSVRRISRGPAGKPPYAPSAPASKKQSPPTGHLVPAIIKWFVILTILWNLAQIFLRF